MAEVPFKVRRDVVKVMQFCRILSRRLSVELDTKMIFI